MRKNRHAFTLTEILLVSCLFAVISLAVFHSFANGFKLWARGQHLIVEGDTAIFLDKMDEDLRQTVTISGISFSGSSAELSFPAIILSSTDAKGSRAKEEMGDQIGAVQYRYDPSVKKIFRRQANYSQALKSLWGDPVEVARLIEDMTLRYYFKSSHGLEMKTQTTEGIPMGILMDVSFEVNGQMRHMRRFVLIPVGGGV